MMMMHSMNTFNAMGNAMCVQVNTTVSIGKFVATHACLTKAIKV